MHLLSDVTGDDDANCGSPAIASAHGSRLWNEPGTFKHTNNPKRADSKTRTWRGHAEAAWTVEWTAVGAAVGAAGSSRAVHSWAGVRHRAGAIVGEDGERGVQGACGVQHTTGFQTCTLIG